ncbi:MAG: ABC transporter substrate-binding protein [Prevotella sp.]|nr:ABC transporter substrate-binding protein [Prevotella sp.]
MQQYNNVRNHKRFWPIILVFAGILILGLNSCGKSEKKQKMITRAERAKMKTADSLALKIAVLPTLDAMPLFLAKERRLFDTLNVDVRLKRWKAQMDVDTALAGGTVEGAVSDLVRIERMRRRGVKLVTFSATNLHWQLITNRTARLKDVSQLGDKMVAMTRYSATDFLTDHVLKGVKTKATVYRVQINDVPLRLKMLLNNEMDALWLPEPQATSARLAKNPVLFDTSKNDIQLGALVFREKSMNDSRVKKQIETLRNAYNMACDSLNTNGLQKYADIIKKYCGVEKEVIEALPKMKFSHVAKPREKDEEIARKF